MVSDLLYAVALIALAFGIVIYVAIDMIRFERLRRRWRAEDEERWRMLDGLVPGIRERVARRAAQKGEPSCRS